MGLKLIHETSEANTHSITLAQDLHMHRFCNSSAGLQGIAISGWAGNGHAKDGHENVVPQTMNDCPGQHLAASIEAVR